MKFGQHGKLDQHGTRRADRLLCRDNAGTMLGPYITLGEETKGYPRPGLMNHPADVAVGPDGDIYVADWGNHRVSIFDTEGKAICNPIGDAQALSKWGQQTVHANPDMAKAWRRVRSLKPQWRFTFATAVEFDPATDTVIVAEAQRNRLQIYKRFATTATFQANL